MMLRRLPLWAFAFVAVLGTWTAAEPVDQGSSGSSASQRFGSIEIRLGMPEGEAIRLLTSQYTVAAISGISGAYMIKEKDKDMIGSFTVKQGRVIIISSDWTPSVSDSGAFGEALLTALSHLTSGSPQGSWRVGEPCSVNIADGVSAGTDTQLRMGDIICGRQRVSISISRKEGGPSQSQVQLVTR
jgi:hypothetical protein